MVDFAEMGVPDIDISLVLDFDVDFELVFGFVVGEALEFLVADADVGGRLGDVVLGLVAHQL